MNFPALANDTATSKKTTATSKKTTAKKTTVAKAPRGRVAKKTVAKTSKPETITMTKEEFDKAIALAAREAAKAAVANVTPLDPKAAKKEKAKARKAKLRDERRAASVNLKEELAKEAGVTVDAVTEAFAAAHKFAAEDQSNYKARYDEKLVELIGVTKFDRSKAA